jgi:hypothetical protein
VKDLPNAPEDPIASRALYPLHSGWQPSEFASFVAREHDRAFTPEPQAPPVGEASCRS